MGEDKEQDRKYAACIDTMVKAAVEWRRAHPFAEPEFRTKEFEANMCRRAGKPTHLKAAIISPLDAQPIFEEWCGNEDARALIRAMDAASGKEGTYLQAKAIFEHFWERAWEHATGEMPPGDWSCPSCGNAGRSFTSMTGKKEVVVPGTPSVCGNCGHIMQVNETGMGFATMNPQRLRSLPTGLRKMLHKMRNSVLDAIKQVEKDRLRKS